MSQIPFNYIDWTAIEKKEYKGEKGFCTWQTIQLPGIRIRGGAIKYMISI